MWTEVSILNPVSLQASIRSRSSGEILSIPTNCKLKPESLCDVLFTECTCIACFLLGSEASIASRGLCVSTFALQLLIEPLQLFKRRGLRLIVWIPAWFFAQPVDFLVDVLFSLSVTHRLPHYQYRCSRSQLDCTIVATMLLGIQDFSLSLRLCLWLLLLHSGRLLFHAT